MDTIDQSRGKFIEVSGTAEGACEQAVAVRLFDFYPAIRLRKIQSFRAIIDKAKFLCDKAETAMLNYIPSQSE